MLQHFMAKPSLRQCPLYVHRVSLGSLGVEIYFCWARRFSAWEASLPLWVIFFAAQTSYSLDKLFKHKAILINENSNRHKVSRWFMWSLETDRQADRQLKNKQRKQSKQLSLSQSLTHLLSQPVGRSVRQSVSQSVSQSIDSSVCVFFSQAFSQFSVSQPINHLINQTY